MAADESLWVSLAALVTAGGAAIAGILSGRNSRLKDREQYELQRAQADEASRQASEQRTREEVDRYRQMVRECEDTTREARKQCDDERRQHESEREEAWAAARAWMHAAYDMLSLIRQAKAVSCDSACSHLLTMALPDLPATVDAIKPALK